MVKIKHSQDGKMIVEVTSFMVRHRDYFHLKNLYTMLHEWLIEEGWATRADADFPETLYLERETQKSGDELWIWWRLKKDVTSYYRYVLNIDYQVLLLRDAEVMHEGHKFKTKWGQVELIFTAYLELDYNREWREHPILKNIHDIWVKRIFKKNIEAHKLILYRDAYRIQQATKTYFKLKTYLPEPETEQFWPELGLGEPK